MFENFFLQQPKPLPDIAERELKSFYIKTESRTNSVVPRAFFHKTAISEIGVFFINNLENTDPISQSIIPLFGVLFGGSIFKGFWPNIIPNSNQYGRNCGCRSNSQKVFVATVCIL